MQAKLSDAAPFGKYQSNTQYGQTTPVDLVTPHEPRNPDNMHSAQYDYTVKQQPSL